MDYEGFVRDLSALYESLSGWHGGEYCSSWESKPPARYALNTTLERWGGAQRRLVADNLRRAQAWLEQLEAIGEAFPYVGWRLRHFAPAAEVSVLEQSFRFGSLLADRAPYYVVIHSADSRPTSWRVEIGGTEGFDLVMPTSHPMWFRYGFPVAIDWYTVVPRQPPRTDTRRAYWLDLARFHYSIIRCMGDLFRAR